MFEYEFRIFGLRRSGNHFLIQLLCSQFPDNSVYYYNDIQYPEFLFSHPTYKTSYCQRPIHSKDREIMGDLSAKMVDKSEYQLSELIKPKRRLCLIQSYEDQDLETIMDKIKIQEGRKDSSKKIFNIVVMRDYRNWLASRIMAWEKSGYKNNYLKINSKILGLWKQYFNESQGFTNLIDNKLCFYFNRMVSKPKCCLKILKETGLFEKKISWTKITNLTSINFGSSFNKNKIEKDKTDYNQRWRLMTNNKLYNLLLKNDIYNNIQSSDSVFKEVKNKVESSSHNPCF